MVEKEIQENNYFEYRQVEHSQYSDTRLPLWIKKQLRKEDKILDYGCGFGQNIHAILNDGYEEIYGIDIERSAIDFCKQQGYKVKKINLETMENPFNIKFDKIILSHVIEHMPKDKIINTLQILKANFLVEGGGMLIAVPNAQSNTNCYWAYEDWTHTTLFTSGSLYYVLRAAGFENIEFVDIDCTLGSKGAKRIIRKIFLKLYIINKNFWNKITGSSYHRPSPQIFSYEIKCKAF